MDKLNFLIGSYIDAIKAMFSVRLWTPYFIFALVSVLMAWLFTKPFLPVIGPCVTEVAVFIAGTEAVLHYPDLYGFLPSVFGWTNILFSILLEVLLIGTGFIMFAGYFKHERVGFFSALGAAKGKYFQLVAMWLFYTAVFLLLLFYIPKVFESRIAESPRAILALHILLRFVGYVILAMFMYVLPYILLDRERFISSLANSVRTFFKNIFSSYIIAVVPYLIALPFSVMLSNPFLIVRKFSPELVFYLITGEIIANMFASFIFTVTLLRFYWEYAE